MDETVKTDALPLPCTTPHASLTAVTYCFQGYYTAYIAQSTNPLNVPQRARPRATVARCWWCLYQCTPSLSPLLTRPSSSAVKSVGWVPIQGARLCKLWSTFVWVVEIFPTLSCNYFRLITGRSSPAHIAAFPNLPSRRVPSGRRGSYPRNLTTGLGPTAWAGHPLRGGCGKVPSRPWQFQWPTRVNLHLPYCWRCPLGLCDSFLLSDPRTWPGVLSGTRLSQAGTLIPYPADTVLDRLGCVSQKRTLISKKATALRAINSYNNLRWLITYRRLYSHTITNSVIVQTSSACRNLLLIQQLNKQQILGMRSLSALLPISRITFSLKLTAAIEFC